MENCLSNARLLSKSLEATGWYTCVSDVHRHKGHHTQQDPKEIQFYKDGETSADYNAGLPVVAFRLSDQFKKDYGHVKQESISLLLRAKQYIIPNYPLPPKEDKTEILRVVVRESMSLDLLDRLISDVISVTEGLMNSDPVDMTAFEHKATHIEKSHMSLGTDGLASSGHHKQKANRPMQDGVHRTVC